MKAHCDECRKFIIGGCDSFEPLMTSILSQSETYPESNDFVSHVGRLAYNYYVQYPNQYPMDIRPTIEENLEMAGSYDNIIFWTKTQKALLTLTNADRSALKHWNSKQNRVIFDCSLANFGSGKTVVLRHKALEVAKSKKVYFLVMPQSSIIDSDMQLLYHDTRLFFAGQDNVIVAGWQEIKNEVGSVHDDEDRMKVFKKFIR